MRLYTCYVHRGDGEMSAGVYRLAVEGSSLYFVRRSCRGKGRPISTKGATHPCSQSIALRAARGSIAVPSFPSAPVGLSTWSTSRCNFEINSWFIYLLLLCKPSSWIPGNSWCAGISVSLRRYAYPILFWKSMWQVINICLGYFIIVSKLRLL